jgi:hypothetical protein
MARNGGWNFPGSDAGQERLIYSFYPALVPVRCSRRIGPAPAHALSRLRSFVASADDRQDPFWTPLCLHLELLTRGSRSRERIDHGMLSAYWQLFQDGWPTRQVTENWFTPRFNMALMCGSNYLHLRRIVQPDDAMALLHVRYLADERIGSGWNDEHEQNPKTWATALGALTLNRWANDLILIRTRAKLNRVPIRTELFTRLATLSRRRADTVTAGALAVAAPFDAPLRSVARSEVSDVGTGRICVLVRRRAQRAQAGIEDLL